MAKKTTTTTTKKQTSPKDLKTILTQLDRIEGTLREVLKNSTATPIQVTLEQTEEKEEEKKTHLINQSGETTELTYDAVKAEADKLVKIDEQGAQLGFAKAREIIIGYGVTRLQEVEKRFYPEVVVKFRKALQEWK